MKSRIGWMLNGQRFEDNTAQQNDENGMIEPNVETYSGIDVSKSRTYIIGI